MAKKKIDITKEPQNKTEVTKGFMEAYIKASSDAEKCNEWVDFAEAHIVEKTNHLTKETYKDYDIKAVRQKFCELFFPKLVEKKAYTKEAQKTVSERLKDLRK